MSSHIFFASIYYNSQILERTRYRYLRLRLCVHQDEELKCFHKILVRRKCCQRAGPTAVLRICTVQLLTRINCVEQVARLGIIPFLFI